MLLQELPFQSIFLIYNADQVFKMRYLQNHAMHYRVLFKQLVFNL